MILKECGATFLMRQRSNDENPDNGKASLAAKFFQKLLEKRRAILTAF